jgi:DNA-binding MarR family transcriptional regulator
MFDQCLYFNTTALARVLEREWTRAFKPFGLTPPQAFMLRAVLRQPGMLQSELARELVIQRPTATRVLDGLQKLGLVERRPTDNDGRELAIHPTAAGRELEQGLNAASGEVTRKIKRAMGTEVFSEVVSGIKNTRDTLG